MDKNAKIFVAGHNGMVGSAFVRKLKLEGYSNLILRSRKELDLLNQSSVEKFFLNEKPDYVFLAAAKVGGILANNTYRAQFIYENLQIQNNVINQCHVHKVKKLLFLGSSCIYPKLASQPIKEEYLLTGELEHTNEPYAIAKIAGLKMCQAYNSQYATDFISVMPSNLYGPNDNFDIETSHVLSAIIRRFHEAKKCGKQFVEIWGTGTPKREFVYVADVADACFYLMNNKTKYEVFNIGIGEDITIKDLAGIIKTIIGFTGEIIYDTTKPDGTPRKLLDISRLNQIGWKPSTTLKEGIKKTYQWFLENEKELK